MNISILTLVYTFFLSFFPPSYEYVVQAGDQSWPDYERHYLWDIYRQQVPLDIQLESYNHFLDKGYPNDIWRYDHSNVALVYSWVIMWRVEYGVLDVPGTHVTTGSVEDQTLKKVFRDLYEHNKQVIGHSFFKDIMYPQ